MKHKRKCLRIVGCMLVLLVWTLVVCAVCVWHVDKIYEVNARLSWPANGLITWVEPPMNTPERTSITACGMIDVKDVKASRCSMEELYQWQREHNQALKDAGEDAIRYYLLIDDEHDCLNLVRVTFLVDGIGQACQDARQKDSYDVVNMADFLYGLVAPLQSTVSPSDKNGAASK